VDISSFAPGASPGELREAFSRDGAFVLRDVLDGVRLAAVREALRPLVQDAALGANSFDGFRTRRIFDPLARTRVLDDLVLSPAVHRAVQDLLPDGYQLGMTVLSEVQPGEVAQKFHRDAAVYPLPADFPEVMVSTIWALDAFTPANGATVIAAGSHRDASAREQEPVVMNPGSVLVYSGRLLHKAGANTSAAPRLGLIVEHVVRWLRPAECHPVAVGPALAARLPAALQELLGFNQAGDFFGFIAGQPPRDWLASSAAIQIDR
jgi:ectoine hydroxylase-related dioxygenase (phytanoyl-CoA dioxygenase family)